MMEKCLRCMFFVLLFFIFDIQCFGEGVKTETDCEVAGQIRKNNTEWNPPFGGSQMPCVTCKCLNGLVNCQKKECPKLTCRKKRKPRKGQCCETCRRKKNNGKHRKPDEDKKCKNIRGKKNSKRRNKKGRRKDRRRKNRGGYCLKQGSSDTTLSVNPNLPHLFSKTVNASQHCLFKNLCLPRKTKYLVYRHFVNNSHAFFGFDDLTSATVDVWRWNVNTTSDLKDSFKDTISDFQELKYPAGWFRQQITTDKLHVIFGAARKKKLKTFQRRLKRTYKRCATNPKKRCTTKILMQEILCAEFEEIYRKCGRRKKKSKS